MTNLKKTKKFIILFILLFIFLSPIIFTHIDIPGNFVNPIISDWERGDGELSQYNETISEGDNLQEDIYYNFTSDLIDLFNCSAVYGAGYLEVEFKDGTWHTSDYYNITVQDLINYNDYIAGFEDFYDLVGNLSGWVDLSLGEANDALFSIFYSTEVYDYPATFSFENDTVGGDPANFTVYESGGTVNVSESIGKHRQVVELFDDQAGFDTELVQLSLENRTNGVIEFWMKTDDASNDCLFSLWDSGTEVLKFAIRDDDFDYYDGTWHEVLSPADDDTWYHIKVIFDASAYGLEGLEQYDWRLFINQVEYGDYNFINDQTHVDWANWSTSILDATYYYYVDAIGYSWESNGLYNATYSFTDEIDGTSGINIDFIDQVPSGSSVEVIASLGGHRKLIEYTATLDYPYNRHSFLSPQANGTIEFWAYVEQTNLRCMLYVYDETVNDILMVAFHEGGNIQYYGGGGFIDTGFTYAADIWYHIKIEFDCIDNWHLWIDGVSIDGGGGYVFQNNPTAMDGIYMRIKTGAVIYIDAWGESWDPFYTIGDNLEPTERYYFIGDNYNWNYYPATHDLENYDDTLSGNYYGSESFDYGTEPEVYYGTYDFRVYANGVEPNGWTSTNDGGCTTTIIASLDGHKKVLEIDDQNGVGLAKISNSFNVQTDGTVEFWVQGNNIAVGNLQINLYEGAIWCIRIRISGGNKIEQYNGTAWNTMVVFVEDIWYHIKLIFDDTADTFEFFVDGVSKGDFGYQINSVVGLDELRFNTIDGHNGFQYYIDAVGYSWDTTSHGGYGYTVGWNINPYDLVPLFDAGFMAPTEPDLRYSNYIRVLNYLDGHNNVLEMNHGTVANILEWYYNVWNAESGTHEFWWRSTDNTKDSYIKAYNNDWSSAFAIVFANGGNIVIGGENIISINSNQWYHIRIDFECGTGRYQGLMPDTFYMYVDGIRYGIFNFVTTGLYLYYTKWYSDADVSHSHYLDALGFSWDPDYCQNETTWNYENDYKSWNKNPYDITNLFPDNWDYYGVLNGTYSIDGEFGIHKKYLELYDDSDTNYYRGTDSFDYGTAAEWYYGTHDFVDEDIGDTNDDITFIDGGYSGTDSTYSATVIAGEDNHKKVIQFDAAGDNGVYAQWDHSLGTIIDGIIDFWVKYIDNGVGTHIIFLNDEGGASCIYVYFNSIDNKLYVRYGDGLGGTTTDSYDAAADTWHHLRFLIDCATDKQSIWLNGILLVDNENFYDDETAITMNEFRLRINNGAGANALQCYLDAYGESWDTTSHDGLGYELGYNINPYYLESLLEHGYEFNIDFSTSVNVQGILGGHNKILRLYDNTGGGYVSVKNYFDLSSPTIGTIEFWVRGDDPTDPLLIYAYDSFDLTVFYLKIEDDKMQYYTDAWHDVTDGAIAVNTWYHFRMVFDCDTDTYDIAINGVTKDVGVIFRDGADVDEIAKVHFTTTTADSNYNYYIDAFSYSWDLNYIVNDNYNDIGLQIWNTFSSNQTDDYLSFWINGDFDDYYEYIRIYLMQDNDFITSIMINSSFLYYLNGTSWVKDAAVTNAWHYIRIYFDTTADTYDLWFDNTNYTSYCDHGITFNLTLIDSDIPFQQTTTGIDRIMFETICGLDTPTYKIDALSYSWENSSLKLNLIPDEYAEFDVKIVIDTEEYYYICSDLYWAFLTESDEYVNFTWYNFDTDTWDVINRTYFEDSDGTPGPWTEYDISGGCWNATFFNSYINSSGHMLFRFKILDFNDEFEIYFDELRLSMIGYVHPTIEKDFDWRGIWRYRWFLQNASATWIWTDWTYYEVIPYHEGANFEGVSESPYSTYWKLMGSGTGVVERYSDDFDAGTWYLDGIGERTFIKPYGEGLDYLLYNYTNMGIVYTGVHWDTYAHGENPYGVASDGTYIYILDVGDDEVYKYLPDGTYISSWDTGVQTDVPMGLTWDGTYFWIVDRDAEEVYQYLPDGTYIDSWDTSVQTNVPMGIAWDGTHFWISDKNDAEVYQYLPDGTYIDSWDTSVQVAAPWDIAWDGTYFNVLDPGSDDVHRYLPDGTYISMWDVSGIVNVPSAITWDGTYYWITDIDNPEIYKFSYNYDISKKYHGGGLVYMQTNTTETLNLRNIAGADVYVVEGEYMYININSTTENVKLKFYLDGVEQVEYTLLENNVNPNKQTILINIEADFTFDSIEFIGEDMSDTEYFVCYGYEVYGYTSSERVYDMYVDPDGKDTLMCQFGDYELEIYERDGGSFSLQEEMNITLTEELLTVIYVPARVWYFKIYHYAHEISDIVITGSENRTLTAGRDEILDLLLQEGDYIVNWTNGENGISTIYNIALYSGQSLVLPSTYYTVYFSLFDQYSRRVDDTLFTFYLNNSRKDFGSVELLSADYNITVFDYLNVSVFDQTVTLETFTEYNIIITVFELQIRHLGEEISNITLFETTTHNHINFSMAPDSIRFFVLANSIYNITWVNGENMFSTTYNITLDENYILTLDTSYHTIYFGLFTYDGLGLNRDWVRFYINNERRDFGRNVIQSESANLLVLDYFNNTLANETIDVSVYSEYNVYVEVYSLYLLNQFTYYDLMMNITQVGSGYNMTQLVPASSALLYRFIPNVNYTINASYINGTVYNIRTINLTENSQIESFGVASVPEEYPKDVYFGIYTTTGLGVKHDLLRFYIDGNRADFGFNLITDMIINITVMDFFNTTLFTNPTFNTSGIYEYNILITLYSLKVKNEARVSTNYTLKHGGLETTGYILPEEIIEYQLASDNYVFDYTNNEDGSSDTININLNQDRVYILNSTYYTTYFSLYDQNGVRLDDSLFSLYLNGTRKDFGFVELESLDVLILVHDYLNFTAFNSIITLSGSTEYNIIITVYELQIRHLARVSSNISISETTTHNHINFSMSPISLNKYILSDSTYNVTWTNSENGISIIYDITLNTNYILTLNTTYYDIFFSLFDVNLHIIDPYQYEFRLNGTIHDFGFVIDLQTDNYTITVADRFGTNLFNNIVNLRGLNEYRIDITLYELQIRHLARENSNLSLYETTTHGSLNFSMSPNSLKSFILGSSIYNITWLNNENGITTTYNINLNLDYILTLNTSYYNIYFRLYDVNVHMFDPTQYIFRLNGTIKDFGFVMDLQTDDYTITVVDRFGTSLFNNVVFLRGLNEYRIDITLYELEINHLATENSNLTLYETIGHSGLNFSMSPYSIMRFILGSSTYNITWINGENGISTVYNINLNSDYILTLNTTYYDVYFGLINQNEVRIDNSLFSLYINTTRKDFGFVVLETDDVLILVQDYLNITVFNQVVTLRNINEYDIVITIFEFQIRHLAYENSNITLYETTSHNCLNFSMASDTINKFILANSTYNITWVNGENSVSTIYDITLDENYILTLDTTYYPVYFSLFNFDGLGLEPYLFKFYINGLRKDFGFNTLNQSINTLQVLDYFNQTLFNRAMNLQAFTEYSISVSVWTMNIFNNYSYPVKMIIERNEIEVEQIIESEFSFEYRMLPNVEYFIQIFHLNGTLLETRDVELEENNQLVSFGFFEIEVPYNPEPLVFDFTILMAFIVIICVGGWIVVISWVYMKNEQIVIPNDTIIRNKKKNKKKKSGTYDHRV